MFTHYPPRRKVVELLWPTVCLFDDCIVDLIIEFFLRNLIDRSSDHGLKYKFRRKRTNGQTPSFSLFYFL